MRSLSLIFCLIFSTFAITSNYVWETDRYLNKPCSLLGGAASCDLLWKLLWDQAFSHLDNFDKPIVIPPVDLNAINLTSLYDRQIKPFTWRLVMSSLRDQTDILLHRLKFTPICLPLILDKEASLYRNCLTATDISEIGILLVSFSKNAEIPTYLNMSIYVLDVYENMKMYFKFLDQLRNWPFSDNLETGNYLTPQRIYYLGKILEKLYSASFGTYIPTIDNYAISCFPDHNMLGVAECYEIAEWYVLLIPYVG